MGNRPAPDQATLLKLLRYEPDTGKLFWCERTPDMFTSGLGISAEGNCRKWNGRYANQEAFTADSGKGYLCGFIKGYGALRAHRVIWCMVHGDWPEQIDHQDQDKRNNRLNNLCQTNHEQNGRNARLGKRNRSGRIGVHWISSIGRWRARIRHGGRYIELGSFTNFAAACQVRAEAELLYGYSPRHGSKRVKG